METPVEKLAQFFEQVKTLSFWKRLFRWAQFRSLSYEAYEEFKSLLSRVSQLSDDIDQATNNISILKNDNEHLKTALSILDNEAKVLKGKLEENVGRLSELTARVTTRDETIRQAEAKQKEQEIELSILKEKINHLAQENSRLKAHDL